MPFYWRIRFLIASIKGVNCGYCGICLIASYLIVKLIKELAYHLARTPARRLSYDRSWNLYV